MLVSAVLPITDGIEAPLRSRLLAIRRWQCVAIFCFCVAIMDSSEDVCGSLLLTSPMLLHYLGERCASASCGSCLRILGRTVFLFFLIVTVAWFSEISSA